MAKIFSRHKMGLGVFNLKLKFFPRAEDNGKRIGEVTIEFDLPYRKFPSMKPGETRTATVVSSVGPADIYSPGNQVIVARSTAADGHCFLKSAG